MELVDYIFCDDIRVETLSKHSLMGVYNDRIRIQTRPGVEMKWPVGMRLCCFIRYNPGAGEAPDSFEFEYLMNGKLIGEAPAEGTITTKEVGRVSTLSIIGVIPVEVGTLGFRVRFKKGMNVLGQFEKLKAIQVETEVQTQ